MKLRNRTVKLAGASPRLKRPPCGLVTPGTHMLKATGETDGNYARTFYPDDNKWSIAMGNYSKKKKEHEMAELKKILIFGVNREYDLWCIRKWLSELKFVFQVGKVVSRGICRIEIICQDVESREREFDQIAKKCRDQGWHARRGRTYKMRKQDRAQKRKSNFECSNGFECLKNAVIDTTVAKNPKEKEKKEQRLIKCIKRYSCKWRSNKKKRKKCKVRGTKKERNVCPGFLLAGINIQGAIENKSIEIVEELHKIRGADIIFVSETWLKGKRKTTVPGFAWFGRNRPTSGSKGKKGSGGVGFLVANYLVPYTTNLKDKCQDGVKFIKLKSQGKTDIFIGGVYAPVSTCKRKKVQDFYQELDSVVQELSLKGDTYLIGDFNARIGNGGDIVGIHNEKKVNYNGKVMLEFLNSVDMVVLNGRKEGKVQFTRFSNKMRSVIDYVAVSRDNYSNVGKFEVLTNVDIGGSDHKAILVEVKGFHVKRKATRDFYMRWNVQQLKEKSEEFEQGINENLIELQVVVDRYKSENYSEQDLADKVWEATKAYIDWVAGGVIGKKKVYRDHNVSKHWWDDEIEKAIKLRRKKYAKAVETDEIEKWKEFYIAKHAIFEMIKKKMRATTNSTKL